MKKLLFLSTLKELRGKTNLWQRIQLVITIGILLLISMLALKIMSINDDLDDLYSRNKGLEAQVLRLEAKLKDFDTRIQQMDDKSRAQLNWWLSPK
jgi:hypothetical protein